MTCGAVNGGLTCDREPGHSGEHRGYNDQIDEPMFWGSSPADVDRLEKAAFDNGAELTLVALRDERDALASRCQHLEQAVRAYMNVVGPAYAWEPADVATKWVEQLREVETALASLLSTQEETPITDENRVSFASGYSEALDDALKGK